jgi:DNA (cytosine-5)-methyltransferase 1
MMAKIKVLNLYCGIGGNRKLWDNNKVDVTAVEINEEIAKIYKDFFPMDNVIIGDAHQYLLEHFKEYDFIWSSPPCPTHSAVRKCNHIQNKPIFPSMILYEEILFLQGYFKGKWVVENVISWYDPLIKPYQYKKHYYWANFIIENKNGGYRGIGCDGENIKDLQKDRFDLSKYKNIDKLKALRNCVEPKAGLDIFNMAFSDIQKRLI